MKILTKIFNMFHPDRAPKKVTKIFDKIKSHSFPLGESQIQDESELIHAMLGKKISIKNAREILIVSKPFYFMEPAAGTVFDELIQRHSEVILSNDDLNEIKKFYGGYFRHSNFTPEIQKFEQTKQLHEPESMEVRIENNGVYWGLVEIYDGKTSVKSLRTGIVSLMLHLSVVAAKQNLNQTEKMDFSKWAALPNYEWNQLHYSEFAFAFVKWLSIPNVSFAESESLSKMQTWLDESCEVSWETREFSEAITNIFVNLFKKLPK